MDIGLLIFFSRWLDDNRSDPVSLCRTVDSTWLDYRKGRDFPLCLSVNNVMSVNPLFKVSGICLEIINECHSHIQLWFESTTDVSGTVSSRQVFQPQFSTNGFAVFAVVEPLHLFLVNPWASIKPSWVLLTIAWPSPVYFALWDMITACPAYRWARLFCLFKHLTFCPDVFFVAYFLFDINHNCKCTV